MQTEHRHVELWRERDWRCEGWIVDGRRQVRLYLGNQLVSDLVAGPRIDLQRQTDAWRRAVHADKHRT
jgi:hypothetical protein